MILYYTLNRPLASRKHSVKFTYCYNAETYAIVIILMTDQDFTVRFKMIRIT